MYRKTGLTWSILTYSKQPNGLATKKIFYEILQKIQEKQMKCKDFYGKEGRV
jgi:hypothetical protein